MPFSTTSRRPSRARLAGALLAISLLTAGCGEGKGPAPDSAPAASEASDAGGPDSGASDGGRTAAAVPADPYPVTPAPDGFEAPASCSGEGAYFVEIGGTATPDLPERAGETLTIAVTGIDGEDAQLTAAIGNGAPRPVEDITLGETVTIDLWTLSVTSICSETNQVEFDLIN